MTTATKALLTALDSLLDRALDLEPVDREAWLGRLRAEQPAIATELAALLAEEWQLDARRFLEDDVSVDLVPPAAPLAGRRVGAYTLERAIGQGGMGTVWLANRSDGRYEGQAAVKLLNLALLDPVGSARFRREGTALARLTHPNIARLIDAGVADDGQPFLVLEHVEGRRIDAHCDEGRLPAHRRLELFLEVLSAVGHAHANLIVHRDIKPSNILVTTDGRVKLLDFGIAKLLEAETGAAERSALTELGGLALTPEYAAPEQVTGGPVTTATDVYALGVLLYVLLAGRHPTGEGCHSAAEHLRAIADTEPPRLSVGVALAGRCTEDELARAAAARDATVARLRRLYAGDLDNIVAKALKKDPTARYVTVEAFADDLRHYLRHEPVRARPESARYRLGKFARRNRTPVALAALALVALLVGLAATITEARRAAREADLAERQGDRADGAARIAARERDYALRELSRAEAINELNHFLLTDAAPSEQTFTVGDLLARATDLVGREKAESDANRADMLVAIGREYSSLDQDNRARELLGRAYDMSRELTDHATRAKAACALAAVVSRAGDRERAEQLVHEGLTEIPDEPQFALDRIFCLLRGSELANDAGGTTGIQRAESALALFRQLRFPSAVLEPQILMSLGESYRVAGRFSDAVKAFELSSERLTALGRGNTQNAGTLYNNWALSLSQRGQLLEAEPLFRKAVRISSADAGGRAVSPMLLTNLARTLLELHRLPEAAHYAERAYADARQAGDEVVINQCLLVRAGIYREQGRLGLAEAMLAEVEPRLAQTLPPGHYAFARVALEHALLARARRDLRAALAGVDRAFAILEANVAASQQGSSARPVVLWYRADFELAMGRFADAEHDARHALELLQEEAGAAGPSAQLGRAYLSLGRALRAQGRAAEAQPAIASALRHLQPSLGVNHPETRQARATLAAMSGPSR